ncbi:hypothetical protein HK097_011540 [Rhizophlyctis rosea]|uniref:S-adenosyl-L-methionine-dependent methyltransferase n=1 Tax=Rhizophlyctis rosea TaxID=64517 RepID=A0AAD5S8L8_9FUNG|nr:hypothetical protein HK097_011540 [Rhizophlyctis rosea]
MSTSPAPANPFNPPAPQSSSTTRASTANVTTTDAGTKLHKFIRKAFPTICTSRSQVHRAFKESKVLLNDRLGSETMVLMEGDKVSLLRDLADSQRDTNYVKIDIKHEDDHVAIVLKPSGIATRQLQTKTLERALPYNLTRSTQPDALDQPYPINDLSRATSGLVVVAKTEGMKTKLRDMLGHNQIDLRYHLICHGNLGTTGGKEEGEEFVIPEDLDGAPAATVCKILKITRTRNSPSGYVTTAQCHSLHGSSKHQIRIHLLNKSHPVIGNSKYTELHRSAKGNGVYMALTSIRFVHPANGEQMSMEVPEPAKFEAFRIKDQKAWERKRLEEEEALRTVRDGEGEGDVEGLRDGPLAYVTGEQEFYGLKFHVTPAVMVPRPASQTLVRTVVAHLQQTGIESPSILDLGTGSGCLLISTLTAFPFATGVGLDASPTALEVAKRNSYKLSVSDRSSFILGEFAKLGQALSILKAICDGPQPRYPFDVIICNPPYLNKRRTKNFEAQALKGEPEEALFAGGTGYEAYEAIEEGLKDVGGEGVEGVSALRAGTLLVLEVAPGMAKIVKQIFEKRGRKFKVANQEDGVSGPSVVAVESSEIEQADTLNVGGGEGRWTFVDLIRDDKGLERCIVFRRTG